MTALTPSQLVDLSAGSRNCGGFWTTQWVTRTCGLAGGLIGLAFGGIGASVGGILGSAACQWVCYYAC